MRLSGEATLARRSDVLHSNVSRAEKTNTLTSRGAETFKGWQNTSWGFPEEIFGGKAGKRGSTPKFGVESKVGMRFKIRRALRRDLDAEIQANSSATISSVLGET